MSEKKKQTMRYTDAELATIKAVFADNETLVFAVRKFFYQQPLTPTEKEAFGKTFTKGSEALRVLRKAILPELDEYAPFNQVVDMWASCPVKDRFGSEADTYIQAYDRLIERIKAMFSLIEGETVLVESLSYSPTGNENDHARLLARNLYVGHVDNNLMILAILAGQKEESVEDTLNRLKKDSSK